MKKYIEQYKFALTNDWNFMRVFRLLLGLLVLIQSLFIGDYLFSAFGVFFIFQALTNTGCCGSSGCSVDYSNSNESKVPAYEKMKSK